MFSRPDRISRLVPADTIRVPPGTVPAIVNRIITMIVVRHRLELPGVAHP